MLRKSWPQAAEPVYLTSDSGDRVEWQLASEVAVEVGFNGKPWIVMMATPVDLEDLAIGLAMGEGVLSEPHAVREVEVHSFPEGKAVDIRLPATAISAGRLKARAMEGRMGCGLCGVEELADTIKPVGNVNGSKPDPAAVADAIRELGNHQPLFERTRSVHAACLVDPSGKLIAVREDVGRHNALDKLAGAVARSGMDVSGHFVVMTSRCSFELVQKASRLGVGALITLSAPTTRAVALAAETGLVIGTQQADGTIIYTGGHGS